MLIKHTRTDLAETISREMEYQVKRGMVPKEIQLSPEAHEVLRLLEKAPQGASLITHDNVPVRINKKFIGPRSFRILYHQATPTTEDLIDRARTNFRPAPNLITASR